MLERLNKWRVTILMLVCGAPGATLLALLICLWSEDAPSFLPLMLMGLSACLGLAAALLFNTCSRKAQDEIAALQAALSGEEERMHKDPVTNVYDRDTVFYLIERFLKVEGKGAENCHGLLILQINGLLEFCATYSKEDGDNALASIAKCIYTLFRQTDIVGRLDSNSFVVFLKNVKSRAQLETQSASLLKAIGGESALAHKEITCSVGGAVYQEDGVDWATLLQKAEAAMGRAKQCKQNSFALYDGNTDDVFTA